MKSYAIILLLCGATFAMGIAVGWNRTKPSSAPSPASTEELSTPQAAAPNQPHEPAIGKSEPLQPALPAPTEAAQTAVVTPAPSGPKMETNRYPAALTQALATLLSPHTTLSQKQAVWKQIIEAGQLDQAIEALRQGAAENPTSAAYQVTLGQAQLKKAGVLSRSGASVNEMGIAGMQADQSFDAALKLDPSNWEAQFFKAVAMSHWPAELNKGDQVVQMLSRLIDQQETQAPQPEFAQAYAVLGDQYLKMGQSDYAAQTWRLGLEKFPTDATLQKKLAGK